MASVSFAVALFTAEDGDTWYSVVAEGDIATGVMHATPEEAAAEAREIFPENAE